MPRGGERVKRRPQLFPNTPYLDAARQGIPQIPVTPGTLFSLLQSQPRHFGRFPQNAEALPEETPSEDFAARKAFSLKDPSRRLWLGARKRTERSSGKRGQSPTMGQHRDHDP